MSTAEAIQHNFSIRRLSPALGAEVVGLDASKPFDPHTMQVLRDAFQEHHLLCFRDQRLDDGAMIAFSKQFGPLEEFPEKDKTKGKIEVYHVANVSPEGEHLSEEDQRVIYQRNNGRWHTDSSYRFTPSLASIMYGIEVLPEDAQGGETGFSNMLAAYAALPEEDETQARAAAPSALLWRDPAARTEPSTNVGPRARRTSAGHPPRDPRPSRPRLPALPLLHFEHQPRDRGRNA